MKFYTVYDRIAQRHLPPLVAPNDATAQRSLRAAVNGGDTNLTQHHQDYDLYYIGEFDEVTGQVLGLPAALHVCTATSLRVPNV